MIRYAAGGCAVALVLAASLPACGGPAPVAAAPPVAPSAAPVASAAPPPAPAYAGHGLESVQGSTLERFRPQPLPPAVAKRVQRFVDVRNVDVATVAPDGKSLFLTWTATGSPQVWRLDGPRRFPVQLTGGTELTSVAAVTPDGKAVIVSRDRGGEENPGLYLLPASGGAPEPVQHLPGVQTFFQVFARDGKSFYFRSNDKRKDAYNIYRYDLATKAATLVLETNGLFVLADVAEDGRLLLTKETGSVTSEVYEADPKTKALTPLFGQNELEEYEVRYGFEPGEILVRTNKLGEFRRLYLWKKGKLAPLGDDVKADVEHFEVVRGKAPRVLYGLNENGFRRHRALDGKSYRALRVPSFPDAQSVHWGPTTEDGRFSTLSVDDGKGPLTAWVHDWTTGSSVPWITPSSPELDASRFVAPEQDAYPARDGTKIPVFVRRSEACKKDGCPVLVSFHGGPEGQARPGFVASAQAFVDAGYVLVEPNVRGSDGYGKKWLKADDGPKRLDVISDIDDAGKWAREHFTVNGKVPKVGVMGGSYGGYSTLVAMTIFAGTYDAGVSIVGIGSLPSFLANTAPYRRALRISEYGDPVKDKAALDKLSPVNHVDKIKAPLFLIQGATDPRVPVGEAIQMFEKVKERVPAEMMIFPDEGHGAKTVENRVLTLGHTILFFDKVLQGK
jgi:dipeptidyl aminopeptidase/acylaminoacyl peptidase